jgi:hypothetical protein
MRLTFEHPQVKYALRKSVSAYDEVLAGIVLMHWDPTLFFGCCERKCQVAVGRGMDLGEVCGKKMEGAGTTTSLKIMKGTGVGDPDVWVYSRRWRCKEEGECCGCVLQH